MAETIHLTLKINGNAIKGESTQNSMGRADTIECISYEQSVHSAREAATGMVTGRRQFSPLKIVKRIDKSSPLLLKALSLNEKVEGVFKFYRPNPTGDGTTEMFYTAEIKEGNIASVKQLVPTTIRPETAGEPPQEEITFVFRTITWTFSNGGVTHTDSWSG
ncbi:MAG: type VI secretion system tube protein TssD [Anaeromyxobacter sp.]